MTWVPVPVAFPSGEWMEDLDGISWHEVPKPRRWHRCRAQTRGYVNGEYVERCACGGLFVLGGWIERNGRR